MSLLAGLPGLDALRSLRLLPGTSQASRKDGPHGSNVSTSTSAQPVSRITLKNGRCCFTSLAHKCLEIFDIFPADKRGEDDKLDKAISALDDAFADSKKRHEGEAVILERNLVRL